MVESIEEIEAAFRDSDLNRWLEKWWREMEIEQDMVLTIPGIAFTAPVTVTVTLSDNK
jgi:hypothetical protein